jgi:hypothetical protein
MTDAPAKAEKPARPKPAGRLRLKAEDDEDLTVVSACLQDAVVAVGDIAWLPAERRLAMVLNRFCWECGDAPAEGRGDRRVLAGLCLENVRWVRTQGIDRMKRAHLMELLAVRLVPADREAAGGAGGCVVEFRFSGDQALRASADALALRLEDLEEPYPTAWRPKHKLDGTP